MKPSAPVDSLLTLCIKALNKDNSQIPLYNLSESFYLYILKHAFLENCSGFIRRILMDIDVFIKLSYTKDSSRILHLCVYLLNEKGISIPMIFNSSILKGGESARSVEDLIQVGHFFVDCGYFEAGEVTLRHAATLAEKEREHVLLLQALTLLLSANIANCDFVKAEETSSRTKRLFISEKAFPASGPLNLSGFYAEEAYRQYCLSHYGRANEWAVKALQQVDTTVDVPTTITVLRRASKVFIDTKSFERAEILAKHSVALAKRYYGTEHIVYGETLLDYGFCLLHMDHVTLAVEVYERALIIHQKTVGPNSIKSAIAHEDLSYASYVNDYNDGDYSDSLLHSSLSLYIIEKKLRSDHLLNASSSRLRALILEELAYVENNADYRSELLLEAENLHLKSLKLCRSTLGEDNLQTAKHYGNLGRLYQTMCLVKPAEKMHKKSIKIKERLLGDENYELALSLGHLASLYNYDMKKYTEALPLYLKSVEITLKLYGPGFSGLEYDYRGLMNIYENTGQIEKYYQYSQLLVEWQINRERTHVKNISSEVFSGETSTCSPTHDVIAQVLGTC